MELVGSRRPPIVGQRLEAQLEVRQRLGIEQLAQLLLAEQLAEQVAVERQRPGPPLGERGVAVVHVGGDVVEQERAREWAGPQRLDAVDGDLAARHAAEHLAQRRQVEDVREDLAVRLDEDREAAVARGDREQVGGSLALLPERRPRPGPATRQEQRAGGVLPEARREQGAAGDLADDELLELVGLREQQRLDRLERHLDVGQPDRDAVVGPDRLDLGPELRSPIRASSASDHGAWTRPPNGVSSTSRQSPSSSRKRSTTIRRSVGRAPTTSRSSSR